MQKVENIIQSLIGHGFQLDRSVFAKDFGKKTTRESNTIAYHILLVSLLIWLCLSTDVHEHIDIYIDVVGILRNIEAKSLHSMPPSDLGSEH